MVRITRDAWRELGRTLPRPRAILAVSAHWMTRGAAVTAMEHPRTIHDFGGFPRALFEVQYPAPGDPTLAARVQELLAPVPVQLDNAWGLDHGAWSVLAHLYPPADIPVVQLSLDAALSPRGHYQLAARLAPLRDEGVLILGSGNVVHNLGLMRWSVDQPPFDWAARFNNQVRGWLQHHDFDALIDFSAHGNAAALSIPTTEHFLPLLYVIAQQRPGEGVSLPVDGIEYGSIGMLAAVVGG